MPQFLFSVFFIFFLFVLCQRHFLFFLIVDYFCWVLFKICAKLLQSSSLCGDHGSDLSGHPYVLTKFHIIILIRFSQQDNAIFSRLSTLQELRELLDVHAELYFEI